MSNDAFKAMVLRQDDHKNTISSVESLHICDLPKEDTLVKIDYSTLNFKDALAVTGKGKIVREWPLVPGVDFSGTVVSTVHPRLMNGQRVVLTGWSVGEAYWGGYSQYQSVRGDWLVPLPEGLTTRNAMMVGTAGLTAMLCIDAIESAGITPSRGPVLVTGAAGGVGSVAVAILSRLGYSVAALTGSENPAKHAYVIGLGANTVVDDNQWTKPARPLEGQEWAAAIDTVGSGVLARLLAKMNYGGIVAACGLAGGYGLPTTVMPFILRGVHLLGVDSVMAPLEKRTRAWARLVRELPLDVLGTITQKTVRLDQVKAAAEDMLAGKLTGRVLVDVN